MDKIIILLVVVGMASYLLLNKKQFHGSLIPQTVMINGQSILKPNTTIIDYARPNNRGVVN